jgi:hypothetical protein
VTRHYASRQASGGDFAWSKVPHGEKQVTAFQRFSGESDGSLIATLALLDLESVVVLRDLISQDGKNREKSARLSILLPRLDECSPRIEEPERRVTGARPA